MHAQNQLVTSLTYQTWDLPSLLLKARFLKALEEGCSRYPIYRSLRFAARTNLDELFDYLATNLGWKAQRMDASSMVLDGEHLFIAARGGRKASYCSCTFSIWASDREIATGAKKAILDVVGSTRILEPMFSIDWHFLTSRGELQNASIEELADDILYDRAYPDIPGGVQRFINAYLDAPETVLVLQGPPGTGKTRLIRAILGEISRRGGGQAQALYTGDKKALESDEIFVQFITGWHDAFVVEDADHVLKPRAEGNEHLHRFLAIADGVVRSQGRKIIFSTNLPNVGDLDDALIRPGRCFARVSTRTLTSNEATALIGDLCREQGLSENKITELLAHAERNRPSLADIYRMLAAAVD